MQMVRRCVGLLGASGETGSSILEALIEDQSFDIIALVRPASLSKPANIRLKAKGIRLRPLDVEASEDSIVAALEDIDTLISAIAPPAQLAQIPLATAAKKAGVRRFVPCGFAPILPVGVHQSRDQKEAVFNHVKRLYMPYTIIDVGWWYQFSLPALPSGRIDSAVAFPATSIPGDGNVVSARTDVRDVGKYVVRAIKDDRTLNAMVFAYNELWTANQVYDRLEEMSGERIPRNYASAEKYERIIADADAKLGENQDDLAARSEKVLAQYFLSWGIRGENTPEYAKYLGYLDGKKLYPDVTYITFEDYLKEVLSGSAKRVYGN